MSNPLPPGGIREYLVGLVNDLEDLELDYNEVEFSAPILLDGSVVDFSDPLVRNSRVTITQEASGESPEASVRLDFNRLNLPKLFTNFSRRFTTLSGSNIRLVDYLPRINTRLNVLLSPDDIVDLTVNFQGPDLVVNLSAAPTSLYIFGTVELTIISASDVIVED
jgi:hypothetical protein